MATKSLVKKTRRPRDLFKEGAEKLVTHITAEEFLQRHTYCVSPGDIHNWLAKQGVDVYIPAKLLPVCNHPIDGRCFHDYPSPEILQEINDHLAGKDKPEFVVPPEHKKVVVVRKKRGPKKPPEPKKYFCLECLDWHNDDPVDGDHYVTHMKFKRKRGKPKKK